MLVQVAKCSDLVQLSCSLNKRQGVTVGRGIALGNHRICACDMGVLSMWCGCVSQVNYAHYNGHFCKLKGIPLEETPRDWRRLPETGCRGTFSLPVPNQPAIYNEWTWLLVPPNVIWHCSKTGGGVATVACVIWVGSVHPQPLHHPGGCSPFIECLGKRQMWVQNACLR